MITWRDSLALSRKRWKRKRIFGSLKYSAPLFFITLLTIITLNIIYVLYDRAIEASRDNQFPIQNHLRVSVPPKSKETITPAQIKAFRQHPAVRDFMGEQRWFGNYFADLGETRYAQISSLCSYTPDFFYLYRTLPSEKVDPAAVPLLLDRDMLSLSWSPESKQFIRNESAELKRWLGRSFNIYLNPWGTEGFPSTLTMEHLDYPRYQQSVMTMRRQHLASLERTNPELAREQDALFVRVQVVGFVRGLSASGLTAVLPADVAERLAELSCLRRGKKFKSLSDEGLTSINLLVAPGREPEVSALAVSLGLKVHDRNNDGAIASLIKELKDDPAARLALFILGSIYSVAMLIIIYQLLSGQVKDAIREIGLLRCIGARRRDIMRIFIVMNMVRLARIYFASLAAAYLLLLAGGFWSAGWLNVIDPEKLIKGNIPDFLITRIDHFSPLWLMGPSWMAFFPLLTLVSIALASAAIPIWHAMGVQPSDALRD
ncbi:MAG: FtsX-like permease family protein [Geobacteraceae bacterium]|nr:FtsX-like permease family protein [Geobacteraceae bacterium]